MAVLFPESVFEKRKKNDKLVLLPKEHEEEISGRK